MYQYILQQSLVDKSPFEALYGYIQFYKGASAFINMRNIEILIMLRLSKPLGHLTSPSPCFSGYSMIG